MSLQFKPKSEKEIQEAQLAPKGDYDFEVLTAEPAISQKTGNPMIKITIGVYHGDAIRWHITDYLLPSMEAKLRHFCDSVGLLSKYESGTLCADDCKGRAGVVALKIKVDKTGQYPTKNEVADYKVRAAKPLVGATQKPATASSPDDGDVPF